MATTMAVVLGGFQREEKRGRERDTEREGEVVLVAREGRKLRRVDVWRWWWWCRGERGICDLLWRW